LCGAANLFHFKADQTKYSIKPEDYGKKPLFDNDELTGCCYLNDFFFYVFSKVSEWQNMKNMEVSSEAGVVALTKNSWAAIEASGPNQWRPALPETPCVSKKMVAYFEAFLGTSPFFKSLDPRVVSKMDIFFLDAKAKLDEIDDKKFKKYIARKMGAWYTRFPPNRQLDRESGEDENTGSDDTTKAGAAELPRPSRGLVASDVETEDEAEK